MTSYMAKKNQVERKWFLVDADGLVLGRMATRIATILMGKHKTCYTRHVDTGDFVVVINADKIRLTGKKAEQKMYESYSRHPGGHKAVSYAEMIQTRPEKLVEVAIRRMLPTTGLARHMLKKLKVYRGPVHEHQAQRPVKIDLVPSRN